MMSDPIQVSARPSGALTRNGDHLFDQIRLDFVVPLLQLHVLVAQIAQGACGKDRSGLLRGQVDISFFASRSSGFLFPLMSAGRKE